MTETSITRRIVQVLRVLPKTWVVKIHGSQYQDAGTPDLIGCHDGRMFAFEVKRPGGKGPTEIQVRTLARWEGAGAIVGVVRCEEDALSLLGWGAPTRRAAPQEART